MGPHSSIILFWLLTCLFTVMHQCTGKVSNDIKMSDEVTLKDNMDKKMDVNTILPQLEFSEQSKENISETTGNIQTVTEDSLTSTQTPLTSTEPIYCTPTTPTQSTMETPTEEKSWRSK